MVRGRSAVLGVLLAAGLCVPAMSGSVPVSPTGAGTHWAAHGGAADESGFSRLSAINRGNVARLGLAWSLDLPGEGSLEATPLAVDGVLYFTGSLARVYAVEARSGRLLWTWDPESWKVHPEKFNYAVYPVNRGLAYDNGRIFGAAIDGRLFALDARTGKLAWIVETVEAGKYNTSTGAPRTFNGKVIIGNGGADAGARGYVTAYDQATGRQVWRFYTVPGTPEENRGDPAMERAAATWNGEWWKTGTGGTVWNGITFDAELNRIYIGTGNGGPYDPERRSPRDANGVAGDNLYLASIVALDADTGRYIWHYQVNPREGWDYKATANMILATLPVNGRPRKVLMQAPTNGFFYVIDRESGRLLSAEKFSKVTWASHIDLATGRPVEAPNLRYEAGSSVLWPGSIGAHNWQAMAFSPDTGLVYIPEMRVGTEFAKGRMLPGGNHAGGLSMAWRLDGDPGDGKGSLVAWDPVRQQARWKVQHDTLWNGGTLATAGGLVLQGTADGAFTAYDAATGQRLWRFDAGLGIIAAPISYAVGGQQYVSILVGYGGSAAAISHLMHVGWKYRSQPRRLLTFRLGGRAKLPPAEPATMRVDALDDPAEVLDPREVTIGAQLYQRCIGCHGREAMSAGGPGPDLRESAIVLDREAFWAVLHEGALLQNGMPRYASMPREQAMQIRAYIRSQARKALETPSHADGK